MQIYRMPKSEVLKLSKKSGGFVQTPNWIAYDKDLSLLAKNLHQYYVGYKTAALYPDGLMAHIMKVSVRSISRAKGELKKIDALYVHHLGGKNYIGFVATVNMTASEVFNYWDKLGGLPNEK